MSVNNWKKLNPKIIGPIQEWVDDSVLYHVLNESYRIWKKLEDLFVKNTVNNKTFLIKMLLNLKFKKRGSIAKHLNETQNF